MQYQRHTNQQKLIPINSLFLQTRMRRLSFYGEPSCRREYLMKVYNFEYSAEEVTSVANQLSNVNAHQILIQVLSGICQKPAIQQALNTLTLHFPDSSIIGATTTGEICDGEVLYETIVVSITHFESTHVHSHYYEDTGTLSNKLLNREYILPAETKALICFSAGLAADPKSILKELLYETDSILLAGGIAGDNGKLIENWVFHNGQLFNSGLIVASLSGKDLIAQNALKFNWEQIGEEHTITSADHNIIHTINNMPLIEFYSHYLGEQVGQNLPGASGLFPLTQKKNNIVNSRVFLHIDNNGSGTFTGTFHEGDKVRFAYANPDMLINNDYLKDCFAYQPEALYVYSCGARKSILQKRIAQEIVPLTNIAPSVGFFTYGEFYTPDNGQIEILNTTMTLLALSERATPYVFNKDVEQRQNNSFEFTTEDYIQSLVHFTEVITAELVATNHLLKQKTDKLEYLSTTDPLTNIANRRKLDDYLTQAFIASARFKTPLSLLVVDIDFFKQYNDSYGHSYGDICLKKVAQALDLEVRREVDLVARFGGEEFVIALQGMPASFTHTFANTLRKKVEALNIEHNASQVSNVVTVSIGYAIKVADDSVVIGYLN